MQEMRFVVFNSVMANKAHLENAFQKSGDVIFSELTTFSGVRALIVYIEGLVNMEVLGRDVVNSFITKSKRTANRRAS